MFLIIKFYTWTLDHLSQGLLYLDGRNSKIPSSNLGRLLNSNIATETHYLFRHAKGKSMVNFYIVNALGQNLENSESCPILRLL